MPPDAGFSRLDASDWPLRGSEPDGLSEHPWLQRPDDDRLRLYKPVEIKAGNRQGEDWAEKVASEVAAALGAPCAKTELAVRDGRDGSVSRDVRPSGWQIQPGAALLDGYIDGYESRTRLREGHSLDNIQAVLTGVGAPPASACPEELARHRPTDGDCLAGLRAHSVPRCSGRGLTESVALHRSCVHRLLDAAAETSSFGTSVRER